jgi:hypothetical protein
MLADFCLTHGALPHVGGLQPLLNAGLAEIVKARSSRHWLSHHHHADGALKLA